MKTRLLSVLLVFLLVASVSIPAVSANPVDRVRGPLDCINEALKDVKKAIDFTKEALKEVKEVNKMARESPKMHGIYVKGAIGAGAGGAAGALAGPEGVLSGAAIGGVANIIDSCYEEVRNDTSKR